MSGLLFKMSLEEPECGGNLPVGWILWRVYSVNVPGYYKPVLIKSRTQKRLNVIECMTNGYFAFFPQYRTLL